MSACLWSGGVGENAAGVSPRGTRPGRGFTLVELLVAISIIAILIGLLLPVLGSARDSARNAKCLSNTRQLAVGWIAYSDEHRGLFPQEPNDALHMFDWGGVDWYTATYRYFSAGRWYEGNDSPSPLVTSWRPVNPYVGIDNVYNADAEMFLCPLDGKIIHHDQTPHLYVFDELSTSDRRDTTAYGVLGTSYRANDWVWVKDTPYGLLYSQTRDRQPNPAGGGYSKNNKVTDVRSPARFILFGDYGPFLDGRAVLSTRDPIVSGWWHGVDRCNMGFLDGGGRQIQFIPGKGAGPDYTIWIDETKHYPKSVLYTSNPYLGITTDMLPDPPPGY